MGTWGHGAFDNDTAADWAYGLADGGLPRVTDALRTAVDASDVLDADEGAEAVAAAETVARLRGGAWEQTPHSEAVDEWVSQQSGEVPPDLAVLAAAALRRVLDQGSELAELWREAGESDAAAWQRAIDEIIERLDA